MSLGTLFVDLKANTAGFVGDLGKASVVAKNAAKDIERSFGSLGKIASQTFGPFAALNPVVAQISFALSGMGRAASEAMGSVGKISTGMGAMASLGAGVTAGLASAAVGAIALAAHTAESASKFNELSQSTGVSVEALSGFAFVAKQSGVEAEVMTLGLERMSKSAFAAATAPAGATNAYTRLGVSVRDSGGNIRSTEAIFADLAARFAAMHDGVTKTALAIQLFGRGGAALIPILNEGRGGIQELLDTAQRLGVVLDTSTARAAHEFHETLGELEAASQGASISLMRDLLPALQTTATAFTQTNAEGQSAISAIARGTAGLAEGMIGIFDTWLHAFEQIGIGFEFIGGLIINTLEGIARAAKASAQLAVFDFSGAKASAIQGLNDLKEPFVNFWKETSKTWADNTKFINGVFGIAMPFEADVKAKPGTWPGARALRDREGFGTGTADTSSADSEKAAKKLQEEIKSTIAAIEKEAEAFGKSRISVQLHTLAVDGATFAQRQHALAIAAALDPLKATAHQLDTLRDYYAGASAAGATFTQRIADERTALDGLMNSITAARADSMTLPDLFGGVAHGLDADVSADVANFTADLKKQIADFGKSASQIKLDALKVTPGIDPAALAEAQAQFNSLAKLSESSADRVSGSWKKMGDTIASGLADLTQGSKSFSNVLKDIGKQLEEMVIKQALFGNQAGNSVFQGTSKGTSTLGTGGAFGELARIFQPKKASASSPWDESVPGGPSSNSGGFGGLSGLAGLFQKRDTGGAYDLLGQSSGFLGALKGIGSIFGKIFGGFLAGGGDVTPGKAYVVGEQGREFFVPHQAGQIAPSLRTGNNGGTHTTVVHMHINGVSDVDSFHRSSGQIMAGFHQQAAIAYARHSS